MAVTASLGSAQSWLDRSRVDGCQREIRSGYTPGSRAGLLVVGERSNPKGCEIGKVLTAAGVLGGLRCLENLRVGKGGSQL